MEGQKRRISDLAREMADKNARAVKTMAREMHSSEEFVAQATGSLTDPATVQARIAQNLIDVNGPRIGAQMRNLPEDARTMCDELDAACAKLEGGLQRWVQAADAALKSLRDKRMAINSEVADVLRAIQDASGLASSLNKSDALKTLADLATAGKALRDAYGDTGLVRLADALLVLSESSAAGSGGGA